MASWQGGCTSPRVPIAVIMTCGCAMVAFVSDDSKKRSNGDGRRRPERGACDSKARARRRSAREEPRGVRGRAGGTNGARAGLAGAAERLAADHSTDSETRSSRPGVPPMTFASRRDDAVVSREIGAPRASSGGWRARRGQEGGERAYRAVAAQRARRAGACWRSARSKLLASSRCEYHYARPRGARGASPFPRPCLEDRPRIRPRDGAAEEAEAEAARRPPPAAWCEVQDRRPVNARAA